jgi:hypothetical protein
MIAVTIATNVTAARIRVVPILSSCRPPEFEPAFMINLAGDHSYRAGGADALVDRSVRAECPSVPSGSAKNV